MHRTITRIALPGAALLLLLLGCAGDDGAASGGDAVADAVVDARGDAPPSDGAGADIAVPGRCAQRDPLRRPWFGDLHVHTRLSFDAWVYDTRLSPADAYRFARGEAVRLPPLGPDGEGTREVRLDRPLDFAAVTDHAEYLGEVSLCVDPDSPRYGTATCATYRRQNAASVAIFGLQLAAEEPRRFQDVCGGDGATCLARAASVWQRIQEAAAAANDTSEDCAFTTFVAWEYSANPGIANLHRNVVFRSDVVPDQTTSFFDEPSPWGLWERLREGCLDAGTGCDVLAIPHNSNQANGRLFHVEYPGAASPAEERAMAAFRGEMEPLVEIFQHKGDSECIDGVSGVFGEPDEFCNFEKLRPVEEDCGDGTGGGGMNGVGCVSRLDFVRNVLKAGLQEELRLGVNPYKLGILASTDTHNGTPGHVAEAGFGGHFGTQDDSVAERLGTGTLQAGGVIFNPGGLAVVWAEENSRESLFQGLRRRETYGTSGPRLVVRFFGGWHYASDLCADPALVPTGYADGVPMGGDLPPRSVADAAPVFVVSALADPGTAARPAVPLERLQIVKGWVDAEGTPRERVFDVAGEHLGEASVDPSTCAPAGPGHDDLCTVWTDPAFDPATPAFYYARVLENPTCRWSAMLCNALPADERPASCDDPTVPKVIRERAWTSPIWYTPPAAPAE